MTRRRRRRCREESKKVPVLPRALEERYEREDGREFFLERLHFRSRDSLRLQHHIVPFADEHLSATRTRTWTYDPVDDLVSTVDEVYAPHALVRAYERRALRQDALNHLRYAEKCVDGRYLPTPPYGELDDDDVVPN